MNDTAPTPLTVTRRHTDGWIAVACLVAFAAACTFNAGGPPTPSPTPSGTTEVAQGVVLAQVDRFGWTEDGRVFYSVRAEDGPQWSVHDPLTGVTEPWPSPDPSPEVMGRLSEGGATQVLQAIVSPSGARILYTRLPDGYVRPTSDPPIPDYYPPAELWLAAGDGNGRTKLEEDFAGQCGDLKPEAAWLGGESLVIGECSPYLGLPSSFVADLVLEDADPLFFYQPDGVEQMLPGQIAISHDGQWLVMVDIPRTDLWRIPVADLFQRVGSALAANERLAAEGVMLSPQWSPDDRWLYFWHTAAFGPDTDACDVSLMRLEHETGQLEEVVSKPQLIASMGYARYLSFTVCGREPDWRLSPDGTLALVRVLDTIDTDPGLLLLPLGTQPNS